MVIALALPLLALVAGLFVYQASTTARRSANALGGFLLFLVQRIPLIGPTAAELFVKLARWIAHEFGQAFIIIEHRIVKFIVAKWHSDVHTDSVALAGPEEQFKEGWNIRYHFVPGYVKTATTPIRQQAAQAETDAKAAMGKAQSQGKAIGKTAPARTAVKVEKVAMPHALEWDWIHHHFKALQSVVAPAGAIALPGTVPLPLGRTVKQIRRELRRHRWLLAFTGAAGLVAVGLRRLGLNWVRCSKVGRLGRTVCGLPGHWFEDVLGLLADFLILENICTVIPWLEDAAEAVGVPLIAGLTEVTAGLCKGSIGAAAPLKGPMPTVPAFYTGTLAVPV